MFMLTMAKSKDLC